MMTIPPVRRLLVIAITLAARPACPEFYDVVQPHLLPPEGGCQEWSEVPEQNQFWRAGRPPPGAGSSCAQQGRGNPDADWDKVMGGGAQAHYIGGYCISRKTGKPALCSSGWGVPEQVNVQVASAASVVIGWVTFEHEAPTSPPIVSVIGGAEVRGVTHKHVPCSVGQACTGDGYNTSTGRTDTPFSRPPYYMHYVRLAGLLPRTKYSYKVKSGAASGAVWSSTFTFRSPYSKGVTRIALYGDMGVYDYNNMENLYEETSIYGTADLIIHNGDHCYNEGDSDERRADAYMQAFEKTLANIPWMPIVGNHEFYAGTNLTRYLDQTFEKFGPIPGGEWAVDNNSTSNSSGATTEPVENAVDQLHGFTGANSSALGALLTTGNHHGAGVSAKVPSNSSRFFSVDFGLTHLVALSMNAYLTPRNE